MCFILFSRPNTCHILYKSVYFLFCLACVCVCVCVCNHYGLVSSLCLSVFLSCLVRLRGGGRQAGFVMDSLRQLSLFSVCLSACNSASGVHVYLTSSLSHVELCWKMHLISILIFLKPGLNPGNAIAAFNTLLLSDGGFIL